jgi:F-type H+-transporting ATPase subunit a
VVHVSLKAEALFSIGPWTITNSLLGAVLASVLLVAAGIYVSRRARLVPNRVQSLIEIPFEFVHGVVSAQGGRTWRRMLPFIASIFLVILVANWMSILPGVGTIGYYATENGQKVLVPFVRAAAADLNFTLGLALVSFVVFVYFGIRVQGVRGYAKEVLAPEPRWLSPLMGPIEMISNLSRIISLSMRLFGNVFAGEVLLVVLLVIGPMFAFVVMGLELLFGAVQALVFALLSMTYVVLATMEHEAAAHGPAHEPDGPADGEAGGARSVAVP